MAKESGVRCCLGCQVHHIPELGLEELLGPCVCPCHTDDSWSPDVPRMILEVKANG